MQRRSLFQISASMALLASSLGLAACGGSGGDTGVDPGPAPPPAPPPPPVVVRTFAYVANYNSSNISIYEVETTGALRPMGTALAGGGVTSVAVHPSGRFAYAVNGLDASISAYAIEETGLLRSIQPNVATGLEPGDIRVHSSGKFAYVASFDESRVYIYGIDTNSGVLNASPEPLLTLSAVLREVAIDPFGAFLYVAASDRTVSSYSIDSDTGGLTFRTATATSSNPGKMVIAPSGNFLHVVTHPSISTFPVASGDFGPPSDVNGDNVNSVAFDPSGRYLYARTDLDPAAILVYPVNDRGELDPPEAKDISPRLVSSLATSPSGHCVYALSKFDDTIAVYRTDPDTGAIVEELQSFTGGSEPASISFVQIAR